MVTTLIERLRDRRVAASEDSERGSLLLDVLIGMAIFALIALIAVSAVNGYRQRAYQTGAVSDAQGIALELEADYTDTNPPAYPTPVVASAPVTAYSAGTTALDQKVTSGNAISQAYITNGGTSPSYCFVVTHYTGGTADAWAVYDSKKGAITAKGRGAAAPTESASSADCS